MADRIQQSAVHPRTGPFIASDAPRVVPNRSAHVASPASRDSSALDPSGSGDSAGRRRAPALLGVAALALIMGLPTLRGGFVGGDDYQLVLNHVLVSRPSLDHAVKLFTIPHRDLYQPVPLLTFSAEFAVAEALGLFDGDGHGGPSHSNPSSHPAGPSNDSEGDRGPVPREAGAGGAWLFHLDNVLIHAMCAVLVAVLLRRIQPHEFVAVFAAGVFAVHPLQVEVVAWVNGRMILLSTLFALLSLVALLRFLDSPRARPAAVRGGVRAGWAVLTVLLVLLCSLSKVRVGLPVLMVVVVLAQRSLCADSPRPLLDSLKRLGGRFWTVWAACTVVIAVLVYVNLQTTQQAGLITGGESLRGPRLVRVLLALDHYVGSLLWPVGLASYYPTPQLVSWGDAATLRALAVVMPAIGVAIFAAVRFRGVLLGMVWFASTIASTLPFIPARNLLAADRYMYLPIIGLLWAIGQVVCAGLGGIQRRGGVRVARGLRRVGAAMLIGLMVPTSWHVGSFYADPLSKTERIAGLFPDTPRVWYPAGTVHLDLGRKTAAQGDAETAAAHFQQALEAARRELRHDAPAVRARGLQLIGQTRHAMGETEAAIEALREAVAVDPKSTSARFVLATLLDEVGRSAEALPLYESIVRDAPDDNAAVVRLGKRYRAMGRTEEARRRFEQALATNPYEVSAIETLAEMDLADGTRAGAASAAERLTFLLEWMPDNLEARTNLGTAYRHLGRNGEAAEAYRQVIRRAPGHVGARLNLAYLLQTAGRDEEALALVGPGAPLRFARIEEAIAVHDLLEGHGRYAACLSMWSNYLRAHEDTPTARAHLAWSIALAGDLRRAMDEAEMLIATANAAGTEVRGPEGAPPLAWGTAAYVALAAGEPTQIVRAVDGLCGTGPAGIAARARLANRTMRAAGGDTGPDRDSPPIGGAWSHYVTARLLICDGAPEHARPYVERFRRDCRGDACAAAGAELERAVSLPD